MSVLRGISPKKRSVPIAPSNSMSRTVREMVELEQREKVQMGFSDYIADRVSAFAGSMPYVWLHVFWFSCWIGAGVFGVRVDPFPYGLLTMIVSLEAIFLSTFVMISQNRQAVLSDRRAKLDLQINLIAEQEITKVVEMLAVIQRELGVDRTDPDVETMRRPTRIREIADQMERLEREMDPEVANGPSSAADTDT